MKKKINGNAYTFTCMVATNQKPNLKSSLQKNRNKCQMNEQILDNNTQLNIMIRYLLSINGAHKFKNKTINNCMKFHY